MDGPPRDAGRSKRRLPNFTRLDGLRLLSGHHAIALVDQALVSGASFLTTVLVARWSDTTQLGIYAVVIAVLATIFAIQNALVLVPYTVQHHRPVGTAEEHAGNALMLSIALACMCALILGCGSLALLSMGDEYGSAVALLTVAIALPSALLREFARFHAFAHFRMGLALLIDVAFVSSQLGALFVLGYSGRMSALGACAALAAASAASFAIWLCLIRKNIKFNFGQFNATLQRTLGLGGFLLINQVTMQVQRYSPYWLLIMLSGPSLTGVYAACMSIVSFSNPLVFGLGNILTPRAMQALNAGGVNGLRTQALQDAGLFAVVMSVFVLVVFFAGEPLLHLFFVTPTFADAGQVLYVLIAATFFSAIGMPAANALASLERPKVVVTTGFASAATTIVFVCLLMPLFGLIGVAWGLLVGSAVATIGRWTAFLSICLDDTFPQPAPTRLSR